MKALKAIKRLWMEENAISAVEYALLLALVGVGIAGAATLLGGQIATNIGDATTALGG
jgi:pilus assembly protein Flp/PilA